jgi:hypothetical protein
MRESISRIVIALSVILIAQLSVAGEVAIKNNKITVIADKTNNEIIVKSEIANAACTLFKKQQTVKKSKEDNPIWGRGETITITDDQGTTFHISLFEKLPFVLIRTSIENKTEEPLDIQNIAPFRFTMNLSDIPGLKLNGTFGLETPAENRTYGSYTYLAAGTPKTQNGIVSAWLTNQRGSGILFAEKKKNSLEIRPELQFGHLIIQPGKKEELEPFVFGFFNDARKGLEQYADAIALYLKIKLPPQPAVYCSWYHLWRGVTEQTFMSNVHKAEKLLKPYGLSVMQIDDGWQEGAFKRSTPKKIFLNPNKQFPNGMAKVADDVVKNGFTAGIWYMPFSGDGDDPYFADMQSMFIKDKTTGKLFDARWGGNPIDLSSSEGLEYVRKMAKTICRDWGYKYIKIDGLWAGMSTAQAYISRAYKKDKLGDAKFADPSVTNIQAFRKGLKAVRKGAGKDTYILGCNLAQNMRCLGASYGLVDGMRIGPDNAPSYPALLRGPVFGGRFYFLNKKVWQNDPDPMYLRTSLDYKIQRMLASWIALSGTLCSTSEFYDKLTPESLDLLRRTIPAHDYIARPVDFFSNPCPAIWSVQVPQSDRSVVGYFNWGDPKDKIKAKKEKSKDPAAASWQTKNWPKDITVEAMSADFDVKLDSLNLDPEKEYVGYEFWTGKFLPPFSKSLKMDTPKLDCRIFSLRKATPGKAQILGTSRHITQCLIDVADEKWKKKTLSATGKVVENDPYEIRIASGTPDSALQCRKVTLSEADKSAGVKIKIKEQDGWKLRIVITSPISRTVQWKAEFE